VTASLDSTFAALSDATRRAIIARLLDGELAASDLAAPHDMTLPAVMKHLRVLEHAGLLKREKLGRTVWCRLSASPLQQASEWMSHYRVFWEGQFDALAAHLERTSEKESTSCRPRRRKSPKHSA
jgi:DNA-binding transcriptional ArsR family regulator